MLIASQVHLGNHRPARIELGFDNPEVGPEPPGERHPASRVGGHRVPDQHVVEGVAAVGREPGVEGARIDVEAVVAEHHRDCRDGAAGGADRLRRRRAEPCPGPGAILLTCGDDLDGGLGGCAQLVGQRRRQSDHRREHGRAQGDGQAGEFHRQGTF